MLQQVQQHRDEAPCNLIIRVATMDDYSFIFDARLEVAKLEQFEDEHLGGEQEQAQTRQGILNNMCYIAEVNGQRAGYVWFSRSHKCFLGVGYSDFKKSGSYLFVNYIYVAEKFRRNGVATKLYAFVEDYAKGSHLHRIVLEVGEANLQSRVFHEKKGYMINSRIFRKSIVEQ